MGGQRRPATSTLTARLVGAVEQETREAALARWDAAPDVFVWRARRCAEAVLYAVLAREGADVDGLAKQRKGLDHLLEHKQLEAALSRETRAQLASLREFGNIAAHYQLQGGVSRDSADAVAKLLAGLLREFHGLDGGGVPDAQRPFLAALTDAGHRVRTAVEEERDEARRRLAEVDRTRPPVVDTKRPSLRPIVGALVLGAAIGFTGGYVARPPALATTTTADALARRTEEPTPVAAPDVTASDSRPAADAASPSPAPPQIAATPPTAPVVAPAPTPPPSITPPRRCADGTRRVIVDGAFCVDVELATMGRYRRCMAEGSCSRPARGVGCNEQNGPRYDGNAANCVTREQANDYCRWSRPPAGSLPTRAVWDHAQGRRDLQVRDDTNEWAADDAPSGRAWVRGPRGARGFSWTTAPATQARRGLSFRCVAR